MPKKKSNSIRVNDKPPLIIKTVRDLIHGKKKDSVRKDTAKMFDCGSGSKAKRDK